MVEQNKRTFYDVLLRGVLPKFEAPDGRSFLSFVAEYSEVLEKQKRRVRERFPRLSEKSNLDLAAQVSLFSALQQYDFNPPEQFRAFLHSYVRSSLMDALSCYNGGEVIMGRCDRASTGLSEREARFIRFFQSRLKNEQVTEETLKMLKVGLEFL